jgi:hypothetical protein
MRFIHMYMMKQPRDWDVVMGTELHYIWKQIVTVSPLWNKRIPTCDSVISRITQMFPNFQVGYTVSDISEIQGIEREMWQKSKK